MEPHTAQNANRGDVIKRTHSGNTFKFEVLKGGYNACDKNTFLYLGDPEENPLPPELYFQIEQNEAFIMINDDKQRKFYPAAEYN